MTLIPFVAKHGKQAAKPYLYSAGVGNLIYFYKGVYFSAALDYSSCFIRCHGVDTAAERYELYEIYAAVTGSF